MLSEEKIIEFQRIYKECFGKEISREEAYEKASMLIQLMRLVYKPMTIREYHYLQKRREKR